MAIWELGIPHLWKKQGTGANSDPEEFEHCSKWQELKTCRKASLFSFWHSGIAVFRTIVFFSKETNFIIRDILLK